MSKHYDLLSKIRIAISNHEAMSFLTIGFSMAILFGATLTILANKTVQAEHVYAVIIYMCGFAISTDDMLKLVDKLSELKDIGKRLDLIKILFKIWNLDGIFYCYWIAKKGLVIM